MRYARPWDRCIGSVVRGGRASSEPESWAWWWWRQSPEAASRTRPGRINRPTRRPAAWAIAAAANGPRIWPIDAIRLDLSDRAVGVARAHPDMHRGGQRKHRADRDTTERDADGRDGRAAGCQQDRQTHQSEDQRRAEQALGGDPACQTTREQPAGEVCRIEAADHQDCRFAADADTAVQVAGEPEAERELQRDDREHDHQRRHVARTATGRSAVARRLLGSDDGLGSRDAHGAHRQHGGDDNRATDDERKAPPSTVAATPPSISGTTAPPRLTVTSPSVIATVRREAVRVGQRRPHPDQRRAGEQAHEQRRQAP